VQQRALAARPACPRGSLGTCVKCAGQRAAWQGTERGARMQVDVDAQLQERGRTRALAAAVSLEQDGRQAREAMAACRQDMEARAAPLQRLPGTA